MLEKPERKILKLSLKFHAELKTLSNVGSVMEIYKKLGSDITDYHRQSIV